jgi:hypothetical protein
MGCVNAEQGDVPPSLDECGAAITMMAMFQWLSRHTWFVDLAPAAGAPQLSTP